MSIVENAAVLGLPIPDELKKVLKQLKGRTEKTETNSKAKEKVKKDDKGKKDN